MPYKDPARKLQNNAKRRSDPSVRARENALRNARRANPSAKDQRNAKQRARDRERRDTDPAYRAHRLYIVNKCRKARRVDPQHRPGVLLKARLKDKGITQAQLEHMRTQQNERCAVCLVELVSGHRAANCECIDHCHITGKVRGLLCMRCNTGYSAFENNGLEAAARALNYFYPDNGRGPALPSAGTITGADALNEAMDVCTCGAVYARGSGHVCEAD